MWSTITQSPLLITILSVLIVTIVIVAVVLIKNDRIKSIGKNGVEFNKSVKEDIVEKVVVLEAKVTDLNDCYTHISSELHNVHLALLRLQIISTELTYETKMMLYDEYKALGGNSYIDSYIKKLENEYEGTDE